MDPFFGTLLRNSSQEYLASKRQRHNPLPVEVQNIKKRNEPSSAIAYLSDSSDSDAEIGVEEKEMGKDDILSKLELEQGRLMLIMEQQKILLRKAKTTSQKIVALAEQLKKGGTIIPKAQKSMTPVQSKIVTVPKIPERGWSQQLVSPVAAPLVEDESNEVLFDSRLVSNWSLMSSSKRQIILNSTPHKVGRLDRKPRGLLLYDRSVTSPLQSLALVANLGGSIVLWDMESRKSLPSIPQAVLQNGWCEEMTWIADNVLAIAANDKEKDPLSSNQRIDHQLSLLHDCKLNSNGAMDYKIHHVTGSQPHTKAVSAITSTPAYRNKTQFFTGSKDHAVISWKASDLTRLSGSPSFDIEPLHSIHTAAVTSLYYNPFSNVVYSGGLDSRLIAWSVEGQRSIYGNNRNGAQIRDLLPIYSHPQLLVVSFFQKNSELKIFDARCNRFTLTIDQKTNSSFHQRVSLHPNGTLLSAGDDTCGIQLWDLRYINVATIPQIINVHKNKVLAARFYQGRQSSVLASVATDNDFIVTEYSQI